MDKSETKESPVEKSVSEIKNPRDRGKQPRLVYTNCYNCGRDLDRPCENKTICDTCYGPGCDD